MWSDNETTEDLLGFKVHADLLLDVIRDETVLPVTIGVFGDWGSGKSSILKIIHEELKGKDDDTLKDDTLVLYFNGWVFEGYDDAKAALLESIIEQFGKHKQLKNIVKNETVKLLKSVNWMRILGLSFKKVILPTATAYFTGGFSLIPFLLQEFSQFNAKDLSEKLTGDNVEEFLKDILKKKEIEETTLVRDFRNDFKTMMDKSKIKRLVVMIDDLDRCTPDRIIENLEAVKLFLNVEKTAFVIGADPRIVRKAIEFRYKTDDIKNSIDPDSRNKRIVSDYLEKLIQVPYNLPKLSDREVETYMTLLFCKKEIKQESFDKILVEFYKNRETDRYGAFGLGDIQGIDGLLSEEDKTKLSKSVSLIASLSPIITDGLNGNPRQIKRFLNTFTLRKRLVDIANIPDFKIEILIKLMVLEYSALSLFQEIYEWQISQNGNPKEIIELERLAVVKDKEGIKKYKSDWASDEIIKWLNIEPKLAEIDLKDYFWISRDQLEKSISGSSLIPIQIRKLCKSLLEAGSGTILVNIIKTEVIGKLDENNLENLLSLLEKELLKAPENDNIHKVFIELMSKKVNCLESYKGEMVSNCKNIDFLKEIVSISNSCGKRGHRVNWENKSATHCGICMPCTYRRAALLSTNDTTTYGNTINKKYAGRKGSTPFLLMKQGQDIGACLEFLKMKLTREYIKEELLVAGVTDLSKINNYVDVVLRTRDELKRYISQFGDDTTKKKAGLL